MTPGLLGYKVGMTRLIVERGRVEPVTVVKAGPCVVLQVKDDASDGYRALQLGFSDTAPHRSTMPMIGHCATARTGPKRHLREIRIDGDVDLAPGDVLTVDQFADGKVDYVDVTGTTKGKGYAGVMKRHNFGGKEASHGVERKHRSAGAIGGSASAGKGRGIKKGKRMAGQLGNVRCTVSSLPVIKVDTENGLLMVRGSVPGPNGGLLLVREATKRPGKAG